MGSVCSTGNPKLDPNIQVRLTAIVEREDIKLSSIKHNSPKKPNFAPIPKISPEKLAKLDADKDLPDPER